MGDALPEPGWYTDPAGGAALRWWDGVAWTSHQLPIPADHGRPACHRLGLLFVLASLWVSYAWAAYFDPRGIGGEREATFGPLDLTVAICASVAASVAAVIIVRRNSHRLSVSNPPMPSTAAPLAERLRRQADEVTWALFFSYYFTAGGVLVWATTLERVAHPAWLGVALDALGWVIATLIGLAMLLWLAYRSRRFLSRR